MTLSEKNKMSGYCIKSLAATFLLLLMVSATSGQTGKVNFSGSWTFNEAKSTPVEGGFRMGANSYVIIQDGNNLSVESTRAGRDGQEMKTTAKYTLDGKECSNKVFGTNVQKSIVSWSSDGKVLSFSNTMTYERDGTTNEFKSTQTWKINETDKTFVLESVMNTPNGEMRTTNVYDKK